MLELASTLAACKNTAFGVLLLALLVALGVQTLRLDGAKLKAQALAATLAERNAQLAAQNVGIAAMEAAAAAQRKAAQAAALAAKRALASASARAARIEAAPVPPTCTAAIQLLVDDAGAP
jgi:hypothetical protein